MNKITVRKVRRILPNYTFLLFYQTIFIILNKMVRVGFYKFGVDFVLDVMHLRGGLRGGLLFLIYDVLASKRVERVVFKC